MLHLQPGIDLDKIGRAFGRDQKLHRCQTVIAHSAHQAARVVLEPLPQVARKPRPGRGGYLNEFLVIALHGTVAFIKGKDIAVHVGNDLDFNVAHVSEKLLHKQARVAKRSLRHGGSLEKGVLKFGFIVNGENTATAAAAFSLEHDGQPHLADELFGRGDVNRAVRTGNHRNAEFSRYFPRLNLVAEQVHGLGGSADKGNARFFAARGKTRVFRGEPPAGVDADDAALLGLGDDAINVQVGARFCSQQNQFLSGGGRRSGFVHISGGHGCHGVEPFPNGTADAPARNTPVGDKYYLTLQKILHFRECLVAHAF